MALEDDLLSAEDEQILKEVKKQGLTPKELNLLLRTSKTPTNVSRKTYNHSRTGHIKIGIISDTHIGQEAFDEGLIKYAGEVFRKEKVDAVYHVGDHLEGMSGRDGQVFELTHIGYSQQIQYASKLYNTHLRGLKLFGIDGNHDEWYKKRNNGGVIVGEGLAERVPHYTNLGANEADVKLAPGVVMKLFHPNDGTAYATSYKMQKLLESFEGGHKPQIVVEGHYHKALYMFHRNIHALEAGTLCGQTSWMRGKKIPAHKGFWILEFDTNKKGIKNFTPKFFPAYD